MGSSKPELSNAFTLAVARRDAPEIIEAHDETLRLFDAHGARLRRYVRSCGLSGDAAEDVVQETFLSLFRHLCLERPRDNLAAWLFQVAYRTAIRHRQREKQRTALEDPLDPRLEDALPDGGPDPEASLVEHERRQRLRSVVNALPARSRQCVLLRAQGLRYRDIARVLEVSLGSVAKSIDLAIRRLSRAVKEKHHAG
jgi:RNA polymerase sigma-70 factor (ECF subfamily)